VVGHEIQNLPQPVSVQGVAEGDERRLVADLRVEGIVVDDIVAVHAAGPGLEVGRGIDVAHAEALKIWSHAFGIRKGKVFVELQAISRSWQTRNAGQEFAPT
jgi:hypothetical protein